MVVQSTRPQEADPEKGAAGAIVGVNAEGLPGDSGAEKESGPVEETRTGTETAEGVDEEPRRSTSKSQRSVSKSVYASSDTPDRDDAGTIAGEAELPKE